MCDNKNGSQLCKEFVLTEEDANAQRFKCQHCTPGHLEQIEDKKSLGQEDIAKCSALIKGMRERMKIFDNYVIPANFFGPG